MNRFIISGCLSSLFALTGCASIVSGTQQVLSVKTKTDKDAVVGAHCTMTNNKGTYYVVTPGTAMVHRSYGDLHVNCLKKGMNPGVAIVKSHTKVMTAGNIIFGGFVGAGVDMASGAAYDYPQLLLIEMGKSVVLPAH